MAAYQNSKGDMDAGVQLVRELFSVIAVSTPYTYPTMQRCSKYWEIEHKEEGDVTLAHDSGVTIDATKLSRWRVEGPREIMSLVDAVQDYESMHNPLFKQAALPETVMVLFGAPEGVASLFYSPSSSPTATQKGVQVGDGATIARPVTPLRGSTDDSVGGDLNGPESPGPPGFSGKHQAFKALIQLDFQFREMKRDGTVDEEGPELLFRLQSFIKNVEKDVEPLLREAKRRRREEERGEEERCFFPMM